MEELASRDPELISSLQVAFADRKPFFAFCRRLEELHDPSHVVFELSFTLRGVVGRDSPTRVHPADVEIERSTRELHRDTADCLRRAANWVDVDPDSVTEERIGFLMCFD
jgi:hypothetical protein